MSEIFVPTTGVTFLSYTREKSHSLWSKLSSPFPLYPDTFSRPRTAVGVHLQSGAWRRTQPRAPVPCPTRRAAAAPQPSRPAGRGRGRSQAAGGALGRRGDARQAGRNPAAFSTQPPVAPFRAGGVCPPAAQLCPPPQFDRLQQNLTRHLSEFKSSKMQGTLA